MRKDDTGNSLGVCCGESHTPRGVVFRGCLIKGESEGRGSQLCNRCKAGAAPFVVAQAGCFLSWASPPMLPLLSPNPQPSLAIYPMQSLVI
jgi:hypothetical protein